MIDCILDTNIVIDLLREVSDAVAWSSHLKRQQIAITPTVWLEVIQGALNKPERDRAMRFMRRFYIEHPTPDDNRWAMRQFAQFRLSHGVEFQDVMIASVAVRLVVPLYTLNLRHYLPLPDVDEIRPY